jgi:GrpB-like predicted nucleotidyltransferase (UPF0157 family)
MTVTLVQKYNPEWPNWFEEIKTFLGERVLQVCIRVEHVGSTSIPGMIAKPIIDLILVIEPQDFEKIKGLLAERGYYHRGDLGIKSRDVFDLEDISTKGALPLHHLYVYPKHSVELKKEIAFREFLKHNKAYAGRLSDLKWSLAEKYDNDREAYMEGKEALCREITEKALEYSGKNE